MKLSLAIILVALVAAGVSLTGDHSRVTAHALLVSADPPVNAQLRQAPAALSLSFSEPLERRFSSVRVVDQDGARVDERVEFDENDSALMRVHLKPLSSGYVTVSWETVSVVDGHRISGSYPLTILNQDGSLPAGAPQAGAITVSGTAADPGRVVVKWLLLLGTALLTGSLLFIAFVTPAFKGAAAPVAAEKFEWLALVTGMASLFLLASSGAAELLLQAADLDVSLGTVFDTRWGERWLWRNLVLLVPLSAIAIVLATDNVFTKRVFIGFALAAAVVYMALVASISHSAAGGGAFWAAGSDFLHLTAASVWIGLLGLLVGLFVWAQRVLPGGDRYGVLAAALQRFSAIAVLSIVVLLVTGIFNALIELGRVEDLLDSGYGRALLLKLLLMVPLLLVAATNAYLLRPELIEEVEAVRDGRRGRERLPQLEANLRSLVKVEFALAIVLLAVVALLVQITPTRGRLDASSPAEGQFVATAEEGGIQVTLVIDPNQPGINTFEVFLTGAVEAVERVRLDITPAGRPAAEARLILDDSNPPTFYLGQGPFLSSAGEWQVVVDIRRSAGAGNDLSLPIPVNVPGIAGTLQPAKLSGDFSSPISLSLVSAILLASAGVLAVIIVMVSIRRPGLTAGYAGLLAEEMSFRLPRVRPIWSLGVLIVLGIGLGILIGSHVDEPLSPDAASSGNPVAASSESIARGQMLFLQNCTMCHGETGRGDGPLAASLSIQPANFYDHIPYHVDQFFFGVITNGLGSIMPSFKDSISEEDRWNILNYLRDQFGEPPPDR